MKRPLKNAIALLAGDLGSRLLGFAVTIYLARVLSPEGFGLLGIGTAVLGHLTLVASPGIALLETRNVAASDGIAPRRAGGVLTVRVILAVLICTLAWGIIMLVPDRGETGSVILLYVASLLPMAVSLDWFFQGREQMGPVSLSRLTAMLVYGAIVVLAVHAGEDVVYAPAAFLIGNWGAALVLLSLYGARFGRLWAGWQPALWWKIFRENLPVGSGMFLGQLTVNLPPLAIGVLVTTAAVGQFSAAAKVAFGFLILDRLFNTLFLPMLSRHFSQGRSAAERLLGVSVKGVVQVMSLVSVAGVLLAPLFLGVLFGEQYADAVPLLQLLMPYVFLTVVNSVFVCAVLAAGRTREYLLVTARSGVVLAVAVLILTYLFGTPGAVLGMVIGEFAAVQFSMDAAARILPCGTARWYLCTSVLLLGILLLPAIVSLSGEAAGSAGGGIIVIVAWILSGGLSRQDVAYLREGLL